MLLDVLREIDQDRAGAVRGRKRKTGAHRVRNIRDSLNQDAGFGDRACDADDIGFLKRVFAE